MQRVRQFAHFHAHIGHWSHCPVIEHIRQSDNCTFTSTHQLHVNVQWPMCLMCACKCAESQTNGSVHIFMHTSAIWLTAKLHEHIRQSDHCTFTSTHQVHVNVQWPVCLTCACKYAECQTIGSLHIFKNTSIIGLTAQLHWHIRQSDQCTFTCTRQVLVNMRWPVCVTRVHVNVKRVRKFAHYTFSCKYRSLGSLPNYINTSDSRITARLHAHIKCL